MRVLKKEINMPALNKNDKIVTASLRSMFAILNSIELNKEQKNVSAKEYLPTVLKGKRIVPKALKDDIAPFEKK